MILLLLAFCVMCTIFGKILEKTWVNPLSVFSLIWVVVVYLGSLSLFKMRTVSDTPYIIIGLGLLCFTVGYFIFYSKPFHTVLKKKSYRHIDRKYVCNEAWFRFFFVFTCVSWCVLGVVTVIELAMGIPYNLIRDIYSGINEGHSLITNSYVDAIVKWILVPAVNVVLAKIVYSLFDKQYKWTYYVASLLLLVCYCLTTGSRIILIYLVVQLLFLLFLKKSPKYRFQISKKIQRYIQFALAAAVLGVVVITINRAGSTNPSSTWTTAMTVYAYGSLSIPLLDYWVQYIDNLGIRTYGIAFFGGLLALIERTRVPLPSFYYEAAELISVCSNSYVPVFGTKVFNAFLTVFFYFYMDFGYLGVVLGTLFFGMASCAIYRNVRKSMDEYKTMIFLVFLISIVGSFARWQFVTAPYVMMFILTRAIYIKKLRNVEERS